MPMLKFKAIASDKVCQMSKELIDELQDLIKCPREYFSLSIEKAEYVFDGNYVDGPPIVEVAWFDRGQDVQDKAAKIITKHINSLGYPSIDVIFFPLKEKDYYENGEHF